MSYYVYRHFNSDEVLLYVGFSCSPLKRTESHSRSAHWYDDVKKISIQRFLSKQEAEKEEARAILEENPVHNVRGTKSPNIERKNRILKKPLYEEIKILNSTQVFNFAYNTEQLSRLLFISPKRIKDLVELGILRQTVLPTPNKHKKPIFLIWDIFDFLEKAESQRLSHNGEIK